MLLKIVDTKKNILNIFKNTISVLFHEKRRSFSGVSRSLDILMSFRLAELDVFKLPLGRGVNNCDDKAVGVLSFCGVLMIRPTGIESCQAACG